MQYIVLKIFQLFLLNFIKCQKINYLVCEKNLFQTRNFQFSDASGCFLLQFLWLIIYKAVILSPEILIIPVPVSAESINFIFATGIN